MAEPLMALTKEDAPFVWEYKQQRSFDELKSLLCSAPIMSHYDESKEVEVHTDASSFGVAAVCVQREVDEEKVIACASRALNKTQCNYGATELELMAVVFGVEKFHCYVRNGPTHCRVIPLGRLNV